MKRKSNWLKNLLQWGTLAAIVGFVVYGLTIGEKPADVEAYCPFGGLQALGSYLVNNSLACTMSMTQIMVGVMLAVGVILFSKLFCGYLCPLGTVSEWMGPGRQKTEGSASKSAREASPTACSAPSNTRCCSTCSTCRRQAANFSARISTPITPSPRASRVRSPSG